MKNESEQSEKALGGTMDRRDFMGTLAAAAGSTAVGGLPAVAGALSPLPPSADAETVHFENQSGFGGGSPFRC